MVVQNVGPPVNVMCLWLMSQLSPVPVDACVHCWYLFVDVFRVLLGLLLLQFFRVCLSFVSMCLFTVKAVVVKFDC